MPREDNNESESATRQEPVGAPVVRGDPEITGDHASVAAEFDPNDPESLTRAAAVARAFATESDEPSDQLTMLRSAAACAALVRGAGSYTAAAERAGDPVTVSFLRKWARVHDLPIAIRRHIARGDIVPSAATHIARVAGRARFLLAWAALDHDLSVRDISQIASDIKKGSDVETAFQNRDIELGLVTISLSIPTYLELRRQASLRNEEPELLIEQALWGDFEFDSAP